MSQLEYALPIYGFWKETIKTSKEYYDKETLLEIKSRNRELVKIEKEIQKTIEISRTWANGYINGPLGKKMTNILDFKEILESRKATLNEFIESLPDTLPIKYIQEQAEYISTRTINESVTFECCKSEYAQNDQKVYLKKFIRKKQQDSYEGTLIQYTQSSARNATDGVDSIYRIRDHELRKKAITWRNNNHSTKPILISVASIVIYQ